MPGPGGPPVDELAYEQATRALDQQAGVLNELRQRTSTLVAVSALVATFLGGAALRAPRRDAGPDLFLAAALVALLLGVAACLVVLLPTRTRPRVGKNEDETPPRAADVVALMFSMNVEEILDRAEERGEPIDYNGRLDAARTLQLAWDENRPLLARKQRAFVWACIALLAQTAAWIVFIAIGKGVI